MPSSLLSEEHQSQTRETARVQNGGNLSGEYSIVKQIVEFEQRR